MATTTNLDSHERVAIIKRINEIEAELAGINNGGDSRATKIKHWERLLGELADLRGKIE